VIARAAVLVVLACALAGSAAAHSGAPRLRDAHPCPGVVGFTCSTLDVPLDHSGRRTGTLHLQVGAADNTKAPRGVLLVLAGGPGQPGVPILDRFVGEALSAEVHDYRVVVFDQRGTGAGALDCTDLQFAMGSSDLYPPPASAVRACARKLGARRQFFGTDDVVADMESLRQALGVDRWTLDGVSYGTYVGERYALAYPQHVAKLVLDSVVPQVGETDLGVDEFRGVRRVLASVCGRQCVADLATVVRRYHDGPKVFDALTLLSIVDPTYRAAFDVPSILHRARAGDPAPLANLLATAHTWQQAPADALDQGLHASALCADWRFPWGSSAASLAGREAKLERVAKRLTASQLYPFDRATATGNGFVRQCLPWPPTPATPLPRGTIRVPTLLVNGDHDLSTPLEWARKELRHVANGKLVVVPGAGHSVQSRARSDAGRRAVAAFLLGS
jgi:pimeloyl-ACP methyl ester carboxylesterase